ncbi:MAG: PEP-CTERM sorting domain-containing protein [Akkermansiaceae bacterium]
MNLVSSKSIFSFILVAASPLAVQAATVTLIDGSSTANVRNGAFTTTTNWVETGTAGDGVQYLTNNNNNLAGSSAGDNVVVGVVTGTGATRWVGQDTGHTIALGDQFTLDFDWRNASGWGAAETIDAFLFYTNDDTIGGTRTNLFSFNTGGETANNTWENESFAQTAGVADAGAVGKTLFLSIQSASGVSSGSFSRLDDVTLVVDTVPEPSSTALLGLGGLALVLRRKK